MRLTRLLSALMAICFTFCSCGVSAERPREQASQSSTDQGNKAQQSDEQKKEPRATIDPNKFAIVIAGVGGEEIYTKKFTGQAMQLYDALTNKLGFSEKNVFLLIEHPSGGPENGSKDIE